MSTVAFARSENIQRALVSALALDIDAATRAEIEAVAYSTPSAPISLAMIARVATLHRAAGGTLHFWAYQICAGTSVHIASVPSPTRSKEFELYLQKLKIKQENEAYDRIVSQTARLGNVASIRSEIQGVKEQFSIGSNVIAAMATGYVVLYYVGKSIFWDNPAMAYACGLVGVIGAMAVEVLLFIIRSEREEMLKKHPIAPTLLKPSVSLRPSASAAMASATANSNAAPIPPKQGSFIKKMQ